MDGSTAQLWGSGWKSECCMNAGWSNDTHIMSYMKQYIYFKLKCINFTVIFFFVLFKCNVQKEGTICKLVIYLEVNLM